MISIQLRLDRSRAVHLHRVRGGRQRDRRGRPHDPRRHRRRRRRRRHRGGVTPLTISAFARMGALSTRNDDPDARVASVRRRPRRLRDGRGRRRSSCSSRSSTRSRAARTIYGEVAGYGRNADAYHITAPSPGGAGAAACMQLALDDAGLDAGGDRARQRARHVHAAQRRRRGRGDPQGLRRRRAAGHVDQGRHRPHDRRRRRGRSRDLRCCRCATASSRPPPTSSRSATTSASTSSPASPVPIERDAGAVELVRVRRPQRHADPRARSTSPPGDRAARPSSGTAASRGAERRVRDLDGRPVSWFSLDGGKHRGAIGTAEGETIERAVRLAVELGMPDRRARRQLGRRRHRRRRRAARVGPRRQGAVRRVGRRADRARCSSGRRCRAPRCCSASPTT